MIEGIQNFLDEAGEAGCYVLALTSVAEEENHEDIDVLAAMRKGITGGMIHYNEANPNDNDNFYVNDAAGYLNRLTGDRWEVRKEGPNYQPFHGEYEIDRWERVKTGQTFAHFNRPFWEPYVGSLTVKYGKIVSKRICRRIG